MKIISNPYIPFCPYDAMTVWPFIFVRKDVLVSEQILNHENIHGRQQKELLMVGIVAALIMLCNGAGWLSLLALPLYYYLYAAFYIRERRKTIDDPNGQETAYRRNPFEREAYDHDADMQYIAHRKRFAWLTYLKNR